MPNNELRIIFLDDAADSISWMMFENGQASIHPQQGTLADLPKVGPKVDVVLFVPTANINLLNITLPDMPSAHRAQAALYALEEQLAEDVQDLHAVVWQQAEQNQYGVAIIRKSLLQNWLNKLHAINIFPIGIYPDIVAIPANDNEWAVVSHGELIYVKITREMGFAIESDFVQAILANTLLFANIA
jgi:general secretion pathway protein L